VRVPARDCGLVVVVREGEKEDREGEG